MKSYLPVGLERLCHTLKPYTVLLLPVGVLLAWLWLSWAAPVPRTAATPSVTPPPLPGGVATGEVIQKREWATIQERNIKLEADVRTMQQSVTALTQALDRERRDHAQEKENQQRQFETKLQSALDAQAAKVAELVKAKPAPQRPTPVVAAKAAVVPVTPSSPAPPPVGQVVILKNQSQDWDAGAATLPDTVRADTAYVPAGSFADSRLVTGVFATSRRGGALPVLFSVTRSFHGPYQLRGPGARPTPTSIPIEGCLLLGKAEADLSSSRANMLIDLLSCVFPDASTYERPIKGYVTGADGTLGLACRMETRDTAYLARTFLVSLMSGAAEAFSLAKRTVVVTPFGGTTSTITGNVGETAGFAALARATADLSKFYLEQAERLMPVLWCESGSHAKVVLQEGISLGDYPTRLVVSREGQ